MKYRLKKFITNLKTKLTEKVTDHRIDKLKSGKTKTTPMEDVFAKANIKL